MYKLLFLSIFLISVLPSCDNPVDKWKQYDIAAGDHFCTGKSLINTMNKKTIRFKAVFSSSCLYSKEGFEGDSLDVNKLYGGAEGINNHENSARIGWRPDYEGYINIYAYVYNSGTRLEPVFLGKTLPNVENEYEVTEESGYYYIRFNSVGVNMPRTTSGHFHYRQFFYFGGDKTAPHYMFVKIFEYN